MMNELMSLNGVVTLSSAGVETSRKLTESEFDQLLQVAAGIEKGRNWILGDIYNLWPGSDGGPGGEPDEASRRAKCDELGLNYKVMANNAWVCRTFSSSLRSEQLPWSHYKELAVEALTEQQRKQLIETALDHGKVLSVKKLREERDKLLGRLPEPEPPKAAEPVEALVDNVLEKLPTNTPRAARTVIQREVRKVADQLGKEFQKEVHKAVVAEISERTKTAREALREEKERAERTYQTGLKLHKTVSGILSHEEFRFVRGVLHPDNVSRLLSGVLSDEEKRDQHSRFAKAFALFNQLEEAVNKWVES